MVRAAAPGRPLLRSALKIGLLFVGSVLAMPVATGCLYWLREPSSRVPGPGVAATLVLDELAAHSRVSIVVYLLVFMFVYCSLAAVARWARLDRLTAALALAVGAWVTTFFFDGVSLYVVRQVSIGQALALCAHLQPVYLNALLAGAAGAFIAQQRTARSRPAMLLSLFVGMAGLMDIVSAVLPRVADEISPLDGFTTTVAPPVANALVVPVGVVLLLTARALSRGSRRAWQLALVLLAASSVLHVLKGYEYESAVVTGLIALALLARRRDFSSRGAPGSEPAAAIRLGIGLVVAFLYGILAIWANRTVFDMPFDLGRASEITARAMIGLLSHPSGYIAGSSDWFYWSVLSIEAVAAGWAVAGWMAPWRDRLARTSSRRARAAELVKEWGTDTLAPFILRRDKTLQFFEVTNPEDGEVGSVVVAYRVVRGVALVSGDPIGPPFAVEEAFCSFLRLARERSWRVAVLGASERRLDMYRRAGLRPLYHGDEAILPTKGFSLDGPPMKTVRQGVHRVERAGYAAEAVWAGDVKPEVAAELLDVEREWLDGSKKTGFVMEMDDLFNLSGHEAVFIVARDADTRVGGFLHAAVCEASASLSLSCSPRRADTPNGFSAFLICRAAEWAATNGYEQISLNFAPFASLLGDEVELSTLQRLEREALLAVKRRLSLQFDNLMKFNRRFSPRFEPRYVVYEKRSDLPRVVLAAMAAEGYLPFSQLARGRAWARHSLGKDRGDDPPDSNWDEEPLAPAAAEARGVAT